MNRNRFGALLAVAGALALNAGAAAAAPKEVPPVDQQHAKKPTKPAGKSAAKPAVKPSPAPRLVQVPLPRNHPGRKAAPDQTVSARDAFAQVGTGLRGTMFATRATFAPMARPASGPFAIAPNASTSAADIALVKQVIEATRKGKEADANNAQRQIVDPVASKLAEWVILRSDNTNPSFQRYAAFVAANPSWPHVPLFRRRAENALWDDNVDAAAVRAFFADRKPSTTKGRYSLARVLLAQGDRAGATTLVRYAWRHDECSPAVESRVLDMFGDMLTAADHKARMDQRLYVDDIEGGLRAAQRLGGNDLLIAKARAAVIKRAHNAKAALDAVPAAARSDPGYIFSRAQWLRKNDKPEEAAALMLKAPHDPALLVDLNQWWLERRILVRKLLDDRDAQTAYRVARDSPSPTQGNYRVDQHFTAGWIALRFLHDAKTAATHFARIPEGTVNPHALSRGGYWQGRAAEAMGEKAQAKAFYEAAATHTATYYGQLARARLGLHDLGLRGPPAFTPDERNALSNLEVVRAAKILYALDERDLAAPIFAELGESGTDIAGMAALAETAVQQGDGRSVLLLGQAALSRGLPLDYYAYPTVGLPDYTPIAPPIEAAVAYSIARQESHFNQKVVSVAHAMGLMQVTPAAGVDTTKKYKVVYNRARLLSDPVYNMQVGAAELSNLLGGYNGSYLLTFAGYNAGRGRVRQWIEAYGDPRDPKVDPVDWAERIPLAETRNYVQRVMENLQVYRARFGGGSKLLIEADLKRGATAN